MTDEPTGDLPSERDINVHGSLDEVVAAEHFLGASIEQAEVLFRTDSGRYQEDLMWMGPRAFAYYLQAAIQYLRSEHSAGDVEFVAALLDVVRFRRDEEEFGLASGPVTELVSYVTRNIDKFAVDGDDGDDLLADYRQLRDELAD